MYRTIITSTIIIIVYRAYTQRVFYYVRTTTYDLDDECTTLAVGRRIQSRTYSDGLLRKKNNNIKKYDVPV